LGQVRAKVFKMFAVLFGNILKKNKYAGLAQR
jgi:hypothetical protein